MSNLRHPAASTITPGQAFGSIFLPLKLGLFGFELGLFWHFIGFNWVRFGFVWVRFGFVFPN